MCCSIGLLRMPWLCYDVGTQVCCGCHGCGGILQHRLAADATVAAVFTRPVCCGCHAMMLEHKSAADATVVVVFYSTGLLRMPCYDVGAQVCCGCHGCGGILQHRLVADATVALVPAADAAVAAAFTRPVCCGCHALMLEHKSAADAVVVVVFYSTGLLRMPRSQQPLQDQSAADAMLPCWSTICCGCHGCGCILQHRLAADATVAAAFTRQVCCGCHGCASWNASLLRMPRLWWYFTAPACCGCHGRSSLYKTSLLRMPRLC